MPTRPLPRFVLPFIAALLLGALVLLPSGVSARSLITPIDISQEYGNLDSNRRPLAQLVVDHSSLHMTWADAAGKYHTRDSSNGGDSFGDPRDTTDYWTNFYTADGLGRTHTAVAGDHIYQAWSIFNGGGTFFRYSWDAGQTWSDPVTLSTFSYFDIPTIAARDDNVFVVWQEGNNNAAASSSNDGASFGPHIDLGANFGGFSLTPLANGGVTIAFGGLDDDFNTIKTFSHGAFAETPIVTKIPRGGNGLPSYTQLFLTPGGSVVLLWTWAADGQATTMETVRFTYSNSNGNTWADPIILDSTKNFVQPQFAAGDGVWFFAWRHTPGPAPVLYTRAFYDSGASDTGVIPLGADVFGISVAAIGDTGIASFTTAATQTSPAETWLATLPRDGVPAAHPIPADPGTGIGTFVVSGSGPDANVYETWFAFDPGSHQQHLYLTRAVVTGSSHCYGAVGLPDVIAALRAAAGLSGTPPCTSATDVNCDGSVTAADALLLDDYVAGLPPTPVAGCSPIGA